MWSVFGLVLGRLCTFRMDLEAFRAAELRDFIWKFFKLDFLLHTANLAYSGKIYCNILYGLCHSLYLLKKINSEVQKFETVSGELNIGAVAIEKVKWLTIF